MAWKVSDNVPGWEGMQGSKVGYGTVGAKAGLGFRDELMRNYVLCNVSFVDC